MINKIYKTSLSLLTDLYQVTMAYGYWKKGIHDKKASFNVFFRKSPFNSGYAVCCGLEYIIDYLNSYKFSNSDIDYLSSLKSDSGSKLFEKKFLDFLREFKFTCDVDAIEEGRIIFPNEPILRVSGPIYQCQLIESSLINIFNFQTLIATKASRMFYASNGEPILEFGLRRAQGIDGSLSASRASYIGGCSKTSNVLAGKIFNIPVSGTHSHSWVLAFDSEVSAFQNYAEVMPDNCVLLVDTYETMRGVKNAIVVAKELEKRNKKLFGIRIDSGDLAYLSKKARKLLDKENLEYVKIIASNDLDEFILESLKHQKAKISVWGIGTKLITAFDNPSLGAVYKLSALKNDKEKWEKKLKLSEQKIKINNPGVHQVRRFIKDGMFNGDMIYDINSSVIKEKMIDPNDSTKFKKFKEESDYEELLKKIFKKGNLVYKSPKIDQIKKKLHIDLERLDNSHKRLDNPHVYPVGLEESLFTERKKMILSLRDK
ncbi:MAG: nicotinate phosphoribosyltransferase [Bacteroidota bacterium]|nr:nicotinate phosphoribosyltransferase [Bacteroidota bacterium]